MDKVEELILVVEDNTIRLEKLNEQVEWLLESNRLKKEFESQKK